MYRHNVDTLCLVNTPILRYGYIVSDETEETSDRKNLSTSIPTLTMRVAQTWREKEKYEFVRNRWVSGEKN